MAKACIHNSKQCYISSYYDKRFLLYLQPVSSKFSNIPQAEISPIIFFSASDLTKTYIFGCHFSFQESKVLNYGNLSKNKTKFQQHNTLQEKFTFSSGNVKCSNCNMLHSFLVAGQGGGGGGRERTGCVTCTETLGVFATEIEVLKGQQHTTFF